MPITKPREYATRSCQSNTPGRTLQHWRSSDSIPISGIIAIMARHFSTLKSQIVPISIVYEQAHSPSGSA